MLKAFFKNIIPSFVWRRLRQHKIAFFERFFEFIGLNVSFLYLEVMPNLKKGVIIHIHDIPFPYNVPYPPDHWVLNQTRPYFWNEAMMAQAFLCYNNKYRIVMSMPLLRYFDEEFLQRVVPGYEPVGKRPNTFSSLWLEKTE